MDLDRQTDFFKRELETRQNVYTMPHNIKLHESYQLWLNAIKTLQQNHPTEILDLCIACIESHESALRFSEYTIHHVESAQKIANLYRDQPEQRQKILQQLEDICKIGEPLFERVHTYKEYAAQGFYHLIEILNHIQTLWNVQTTYHQGEFAFPPEMLTLIDRYIDDLGPYRGLSADEREPIITQIRLEIVQKYPEETFKLFMLAIQKEEYFDFWLSKKLFFVLMEQKDKRLNRPDLLEQLLVNFDLIIKKMIYAKPFILHLAFSIEKLAKAKQLNENIVNTLENINFIQHDTQSIPMKRLEQIQQKAKAFILEFRQQHAITSSNLTDPIIQNFVQYQLPFSDTTTKQIWVDSQKVLWPVKLQQQFEALNEIEKQNWQAFWQHIDANSSKKPSKKWLQEAELIFPKIQNQLLENLTLWLKFIALSSPKNVRPFDSKNENTIKGLLWFAILLPTEPKLLEVLTTFCRFCYHKISGVGATSGALGTVTIYVLSQHGQQGIEQLEDLQHSLKYDAAQTAIQKALESIRIEPDSTSNS